MMLRRQLIPGGVSMAVNGIHVKSESMMGISNIIEIVYDMRQEGSRG